MVTTPSVSNGPDFFVRSPSQQLFFDYRYDKVDDDERKYKPAYAFDWANGCDSK